MTHRCCVWSEERTVIPGLKTAEGEQRQLFLLIDGRTESPIATDGLTRARESHFFIPDYFQSREQANQLAYSLHEKRCHLKKCAWTKHKPKEPKKPVAFRRYNMARGPIP